MCCVSPLPTDALGPIYRFTVGGAGKGGGGGAPPSPAPWGQGRGLPLVARSFLSLGGPRRGELVSSGSGRLGAGCRLRGGVPAGRVWAPFFSSVQGRSGWGKQSGLRKGCQTSGGEGVGGGCQGSLTPTTTRPACPAPTGRSPPARGRGDQAKPQGVLVGPAQETAETLVTALSKAPYRGQSAPFPLGALGSPQQVVPALPAAPA